MLASDDIHLDWCFSTDSLWSTRYFNAISNVGRVKSFVDDLNGTWSCKRESSLVLRSAECQPLFRDLYVIFMCSCMGCRDNPSILPPLNTPQSDFAAKYSKVTSNNNTVLLGVMVLNQQSNSFCLAC